MKDNSIDNPLHKLSNPAQRALANAGITDINQLAAWREADFMKLHGTGKKGLQILKALMAERNIAFRQM
ncbi:helix-hairpin-helix domain-containing protein [Mucilaginibacter ginsenosidivorax]|uniref:DNA-binding protein n=1 Tax=Mucilaginibacter ginsenosidivorax TaxID=862126 RepID=A0A5B8VTC7_9SPHI|nr:DNA-binding protein [Mucilaginibacter ginsenosidivorax]QEC74857.1 DNA-binding protein [Mucilaginibacter ginsenosidivorax]